MGLEKAIFYGKEHRKPYRGAKAFDTSCRNHGGHKHHGKTGNPCPWCEGNRLHNSRLKTFLSKFKLKEYFKGNS